MSDRRFVFKFRSARLISRMPENQISFHHRLNYRNSLLQYQCKNISVPIIFTMSSIGIMVALTCGRTDPEWQSINP
jgi:hypothetical protein